MEDQRLSGVLPTGYQGSAGLASALDRPLTITKFGSARADTRSEFSKSLRELAPLIRQRQAPSKERLPWLKLARFGDVKSDKGSLRHDGNVEEIAGIEVDYDDGGLTVAEAAARLREHDIAGLIYTTPSHKASAPRWRVLCPTSESLPPDRRAALVARLNGIFGGSLDGASFTLSQSFYYGGVGSAAPDVKLVEGRFVDVAAELDASAIGRNSAPAVVETAELRDRREPEWDRLRSALDAIPAAARDNREACWRPVGMALHDQGGGSEEAFELWDEWSRVSGKYDAADQRRVWESFGARGGRRLGVGSLYTLAKTHGWDAKRRSEPAAAEPSRLTFLSPGECAALPARGYVVKGVLAPGDVGCIFGAPAAGKSLIAPHIGYMVARGDPAFGMRTRAGGVLYVAAEDPHGMRSRVTALKLAHGDAPQFSLVEGVSDLLADLSSDLEALLAAVEERRPALIFLDTLAMSFPGLEENTAEGMGRVVAVARQLAAHGAAVVLIHHDTKAEGSTPRGHSVLNGALDMALQLHPRDEGGIIRGRLTKNRNGPCDRDFAFRIATRELGEDTDGDPITAALADELAPGSAPKRERLNPAEAAALAVLREMVAAGERSPDGRLAVAESRWRKACDASRLVSASDNAESRRKAIQRALSSLARKGRVDLRDGWASPAVEPHDAGDRFAEINSEEPL